jgi:hypothetical protein
MAIPFFNKGKENKTKPKQNGLQKPGSMAVHLLQRRRMEVRSIIQNQERRQARISLMACRPECALPEASSLRDRTSHGWSEVWVETHSEEKEAKSTRQRGGGFSLTIAAACSAIPLRGSKEKGLGLRVRTT